MSRSFRSLVAAFLTSALILTQSACAISGNSMPEDKFNRNAVPVVFDGGTLRPLGILMTGVGFMSFCVVTPFVAITRPTDIGKVFRKLVIEPARYTWVEPLGFHDDGTRIADAGR